MGEIHSGVPVEGSRWRSVDLVTGIAKNAFSSVQYQKHHSAAAFGSCPVVIPHFAFRCSHVQKSARRPANLIKVSVVFLSPGEFLRSHRRRSTPPFQNAKKCGLYRNRTELIKLAYRVTVVFCMVIREGRAFQTRQVFNFSAYNNIVEDVEIVETMLHPL